MLIFSPFPEVRGEISSVVQFTKMQRAQILQVLEMVQNATALNFLRAETSSVLLEAEAARSVHRAAQLLSAAAATLASARTSHQFILTVVEPEVLLIVRLAKTSANSSRAAMLHTKEADEMSNRTKVCCSI